jgi:histidine ammonia-lyase
VAGEPGPDEFLAPILEHSRALLVGTELRTEIEAAIGTLA